MTDTTVGTCSLCGGRVAVPTVWGSLLPPIPTCTRCGATAAQNYGPTIPMVPSKPSIFGGGARAPRFSTGDMSDD